MSDVTLRNAAANAAASDLEINAWYAIGNGSGAGNQVSTQRVQPAYSAAVNSVAALTDALAFTGTPAQAVTHLLVFDASTAGNLRFARALTGDLAFNAAGNLQLIAAPVVVS